MKVRSAHFIRSLLVGSLLLTGASFGQTTERVSVDSLGVPGNGHSYNPSVSGDGHYVAFHSVADNLVPDDKNGAYDIFVYDRTTGVPERVSVDSFGVPGNGQSFIASISVDGRYVAFYSAATNLVPGDTNGATDVFVHDRTTGVTQRVSVDSFGVQGNFDSSYPSISGDGRYVAFHSLATNLVSGDTNGAIDVFVHDLTTGVTERVSVNSMGIEGDFKSVAPSISMDGRYVAFHSEANNLVLGDTNGVFDIFVHDRTTGVTERMSVDSFGVQGNDHCFVPSISGDGRYVAFHSGATNLVPGDTNGAFDIFVHDRTTGATERVSVDSFGLQGNSDCYAPSISFDGHYVAFESKADNLVPGDTGGYKDILVHDRMTGLTERVSVDSFGAQGNDWSFEPSISASGSVVTFQSPATNLVPGDMNGTPDVFVRDRWNGLGANSIYLAGPSSAPVQAPLSLSWFTAQPNSQYWLTYSQNNGGSVVAGHSIDLSPPLTVLAAGVNAMNGAGSYASPPVPPGAVGLTVYLEVVALDAGGVLYDSNVLPVTFY